MTPVEFREDVRRTRDLLQEVTGRVICGYRAPSYSITKRCLWALEVLIEEGYQYDASIFPIYHDRYGIPSAPRHIHVIETPAGSLIEIPPSTCRFAGFNLPIAGGGYFRMLPYGLIRWGMRRVNRSEARPIVFYIHPWEVDPGQPRLPASWLNRVRHYRNLHRAEARLRLLLTEVSFAPLSQLVREHLEPALAQVSPALAGPAVVGEPL
jgi:polysaccharide deacetylase family protein (PEP-CTERM system associated)